MKPYFLGLREFKFSNRPLIFVRDREKSKPRLRKIKIGTKKFSSKVISRTSLFSLGYEIRGCYICFLNPINCIELLSLWFHKAWLWFGCMKFRKLFINDEKPLFNWLYNLNVDWGMVIWILISTPNWVDYMCLKSLEGGLFYP